MKLHKRVAKALGYSLLRIKRDHLLLENHLPKLLKAHGINLVIDVGANRGQFGGMLRAIGYRGRIESFEPVSHCHAALSAVAADDPQWNTHHHALGREATELSINVSASDDFSSFRAASEFGRSRFTEQMQATRTEQVPVRRLDSLFDELLQGIDSPRVFLKLDTQGFDLDVFEGASGCLERIQGLQSEMSVLPIYDGMPDYLSALSSYRAAGFEVSGFFPVTRQPDSLALIEFDVVMLRP